MVTQNSARHSFCRFGGVGLHLFGIAHDIPDGHRLEDNEDHNPVSDARVDGHLRNPLGNAHGKGVGDGGGKAGRHPHIDHRAAHQGVIAQGNADAHKDGHQAIGLLKDAQHSAQQAEDQHADGDQQVGPALHLPHQQLDGVVQGPVFGEHVDIAIGKDNQKQDVRRVHISPLQGQEDIKHTGQLPFGVVEGLRHHHHPAAGRVLHPVILPGGDQIAHDHHRQQNDGQDHIGMRHFKAGQLLLQPSHNLSTPLLHYGAFQHMAFPPRKTCSTWA